MGAPEASGDASSVGASDAGGAGAGSSRPIDLNELENLLGPTLTTPVALAVSGGADSMALMHLVAQLAASRPERTTRDWVIVFTVDHQLRPGSAAEADFVKSAAERLGLPHRTLVWSGAKPTTGVQASARAARYALMTDAIKAENAGGGPLRRLVTAHHADDQAETLLMRLARGSGTRGLASMRALSDRDGVQLIRPLIEVAKARLLATLQARGVSWCEDPSNANFDFERVRVRHAMPYLEGLGFDSGRLVLSAKRLARADEALDVLTAELATAARVKLHGGAFASLDLELLRKGPAEARIRLLGRLLNANGGQSEGPLLAQVEDLDRQICGSSGPAVGRGVTLGGCELRWDAKAGQLQIFREGGRSDLAPVVLTPGQKQAWDRRFRVGILASPAASQLCQNGPVSVRALGGEAYATLRKLLKHQVPALAGATLPAFFHNGELIAVPYLAGEVAWLAGPMSGQQPLCQVAALNFDDHMRWNGVE